MLSDEEKTALEFIKINNKHKYCDKDDVDFLLNLIEKQSKEIEELKEKNEYLPNWVSKKYVSKDKIKAKIEEMDNIISQNEGIIFNGRYEHLHTLTEARIVKGEMQSLLENE